MRKSSHTTYSAYVAESNPFVVSGPELLDELKPEIRTLNPLYFGMFRGLARTSDMTTFGESRERLARYNPAVDKAIDLDIASALDGKPLAHRPVSTVSPPTVRVVADMPARLEKTTGQATLYDTSRYVAAVALAAAKRASADIDVKTAMNGQVGTLYKGPSQRAYIAMNSIDDRALDPTMADAGRFSNLLQLASLEKGKDRSVMVVSSDFMDEYDRESGTFGWEEPLEDLHAMYGDRLVITALQSPAQLIMPMGLNTSLSISDTLRAREAHSGLAVEKHERIAEVLGSMRHAFIDAGHPTEPIKNQVFDFLVSKP